MRLFFSLFVTLCGGFFGFQFFREQLHSTEQKRTLASEKSQFDLSCLKEEQLLKAVKKRILNGLKTSRREGHLGFEIGHFVFSPKGPPMLSDCHVRHAREVSSWNPADEYRKLACREYPNLKLYFVADESAESGERRKFEVETDCRIATDISKTETVWIPWGKLASEKPFEGEMQLSEPSKVHIRTHHLTDSWPKKWILEKIELRGPAGEVIVNQQDFKDLAGRPFVFDFP